MDANQTSTDRPATTGADALINTLIANDVTACFANPGTSEMHFVAALDRQPKMRPVLCLFEGVATGAADGFGRVAERPACTLLHLGPGYTNGAANLHNARRAFTPIVNVIGDHATYHRQYDAPLNSDIPALAGPNSLWLKSADSPDAVAGLAAEAVAASFGPPGGPVSLILPADSAWLEARSAGPVQAQRPTRPEAPAARVDEVARAVRTAKKPVVLIGGDVGGVAGSPAVGRLNAAGLRVLTDTFISRQSRGAGRFLPDKMQYFGEMALQDLAGVDLMIVAGTTEPVAFFAYPGRPSVLVPEGCRPMELASRAEDAVAALDALADALGAPRQGPVQPLAKPEAPTGPLNAKLVGVSIARHLPEGTIICDDAATSAGAALAASATGEPHELLSLTGGAIGQAIPVSIGAAVAAPDRKVLSLNGDGAAAYTLQGLWTLARENLDVTVVIFANHMYRILNIELARTGAGAKAGPAAAKLLDLHDPSLDWVSLAKGFGLPAVRC
ncbi:MAG: acetolactate synthase large subunit, partial [Phenylobacterium sp.]